MWLERGRLSSRQNRGQAVRSAWGFLKRFGIDGPAVLLLGVEPKGLETGTQADTCAPACAAYSFSHSNLTRETTYMSTVRRVGT